MEVGEEGDYIPIATLSPLKWQQREPTLLFCFVLKRYLLWTLSYDFAPHTERNIETTFIAVYFDAEIIQVVTA